MKKKIVNWIVFVSHHQLLPMTLLNTTFAFISERSLKNTTLKYSKNKIILTWQIKVYRWIRLTCFHPCCHPNQTTWWFIWNVAIVQFARRNSLLGRMCKQIICSLPNESSHDLNYVSRFGQLFLFAEMVHRQNLQTYISSIMLYREVVIVEF